MQELLCANVFTWFFAHNPVIRKKCAQEASHQDALTRTHKKNYFASSDPHHDISKQLVDTTFV